MVDGVAIRRLFRSMVRLTRGLPEPKRSRSLLRIREGFRKDLDDPTDSEELNRRVGAAEDNIDFLRILTPKYTHGGVDRGSLRIVSRGGTLETHDGEEDSRGSAEHKGEWHRDPEVLSWHNRLVRRQHFMDRRRR